VRAQCLAPGSIFGVALACLAQPFPPVSIRTLFFLITWPLLASLAGCSPAPPPPTFRIGFSQNSTNGEWRKAVLTGMQRELSFHPEVQLHLLNAKENSRLQIKQIQQLLDEHIDLLIVSANETRALTPAVAEAYRRGVPVVLLDRRIASDDYTAYVGGDNEEVGLTAARYAARLLHERGSVLEILGGNASPAALSRHQGFVQGLAAYPSLHLAAAVPSNWNVVAVQRPLRAALLAHPEVKLIFAHNDRLALSAAEVLHQLGRERQVRLIGVDALKLEPVRTGVLTASILYATAGEDAIRTALHILHHQPFRRENILGTLVVDSTNVLTMQRQATKIDTQQADIARQQGLLHSLRSTYATLQTALYGLLGTLLVAVALGMVAWRAARRNRLINEQLAQQNARNDEINQQLSHQNEEIRQQRNQLEALAEQARADTEAKLRFFTNFSHELRTPLTLILGPVEELLGDASLSRAQRHDVALVRRNTQRLLQLVSQLLDFRKVEVGKMAVQAREGDLVAFVRELAEPFEKLAQLRGVRWQVLAAEPRLPAWFDGVLLDKVILNLLSNALKFTPEGGRITVSIQPAEQGQAVRISVADSGPGIAEADQPHVFEWFYQGAQRPGTKGSGMGLALAHSLARLHQGQLTFSSQPGQGSIFTVTLPRELPEALRVLGPAPAPEWEGEYTPELIASDEELATDVPAPAADALVLVVEDNPEVNDFVARKLRGYYRVRTAPDGHAGVQLATELLPDLVVCDVMMPGLSGLELVQQLKNDWRTSHIPVVLLTARHAPEQQVEGVQAGADLYLTKPFNPTFLLESVRTLLANRQRQREHFRRELSLDLATVTPGPDQKFLADLTAVVEANLTKTDLSVDEVASLLSLSRMQLYRKVKALLGTGVTDFIQRLRLTKARELLLDERRTVSDVAYELGFSSPSYFAASFKAHYQLTPSEFRALHVGASA
jgi:signal transduction histidine kinase/DNA-binding response OmpR family regulator